MFGSRAAKHLADGRIVMHVARCWTRCYLSIVTAALVAAASLLPGNAQGPPKWADRKNATPGVHLTLQEVKREHTARGTEVTYRAIADGLPDDKTYQLWAANDEISSFRLLPIPDNLVLESLQRGIDYTIYGYLKGEPLAIIITSTDRTVQAFAEVYPFPLEGKDGPCRLWAQLISHQGTAFAIFGEGFGPEEEVATISQSGSEIIRKTQKASPDGTLPVNIVAPAVVGKQSGTATFSVAGKSCVPTVNYEWGPPALQVQ